MKLFVGYSKAPEQPQSSARPICHSHTMANTGREPATIHIAAYGSSPRYALRHGRRWHTRTCNVTMGERKLVPERSDSKKNTENKTITSKRHHYYEWHFTSCYCL